MGRNARQPRTKVYVDGFNLYHALKERNWRQYYWLDVVKFAERLAGGRRLCKTEYFTARIKGRHSSDSAQMAAEREAKRLRQQAYLQALETLKWLEITYGHYRVNPAKCRSCKARYGRPEEKMTDVNIATKLLVDAFTDRIDEAIIVSADSDLVPAIRAVREHFPQRSVIVAFPPGRYTSQLDSASSEIREVRESNLRDCQLNGEIVRPNGFVLRRPPEWQ